MEDKAEIEKIFKIERGKVRKIFFVYENIMILLIQSLGKLVLFRCKKGEFLK